MRDARALNATLLTVEHWLWRDTRQTRACMQAAAHSLSTAQVHLAHHLRGRAALPS